MNKLIANYANLEGALRDLVKDDEEYVLVKHTLRADEKIGLHYHKHANEWVIVLSGMFDIEIEGEKNIVSTILADWVRVVHFPVGKKHSFRAVSPGTYFVLRDRQDESVFV
jgi:quercetin dioxygenase-like cupin family protein